MRIAHIAPLKCPVPPPAYGGTELIVHELSESQIRRGHDVTLFACATSVSSARLIPGSEIPLKDSKLSSSERHILSMANVLNCLKRADEFDIIHNHSFPEGLAMAALSSTPCLTTMHEGLNGMLSLFLQYTGWFNTISRSQLNYLLPQVQYGHVGTIHNAINVDSFPFSANGDRQDYMLFLASIQPKKGPDIAIEVARRLDRQLIIAGNISEEHPEFFREKIEPHVDGELVRYIGEADQREKRELLVKAYCLIAPIRWEEPFGLQFAEAMACGTPVVAFKRGAVPEIVIDGTTGFTPETLDEMVADVKNVPWIDPVACRQHVKNNFDIPVMVNGYEQLYEKVFEMA